MHMCRFWHEKGAQFMPAGQFLECSLEKEAFYPCESQWLNAKLVWTWINLDIRKSSSLSSIGGLSDEATPVTCAPTLGRGTPGIPGCRTGRTPVSLSVKPKHTGGSVRKVRKQSKLCKGIVFYLTQRWKSPSGNCQQFSEREHNTFWNFCITQRYGGSEGSNRNWKHSQMWW